VNGSNVGSPVTSPTSGNTYSTSFNSTTYLDVTYTLTAVASDSGGNTATSAPSSFTTANGNSPGTPFLTNTAPSSATRNNLSTFVGLKFTVGSANITVTELGRWVASGNTQTHIIKLVSSSGTDIAGGSVSLSLSGIASGQYAYAVLASPIVLQANTSYYIVSQEFNGGDLWYDQGPVTVANSSAGAVNDAVYLSSSYTNGRAGSYSYVPVNFQYHF
jgi:hypothetical protein